MAIMIDYDELVEKLRRYAESVMGEGGLICGPNMLRAAMEEAAAAIEELRERGASGQPVEN
jgi:hypothetical protein